MEDADLHPRWKDLDDSGGGWKGNRAECGRSDKLYGKPWPFTGWEMAGDQLQRAREAGDARLYCARWWW